MDDDRSEGWEEIADRFIAARSRIGADLVQDWARRHLRAGDVVLDIGCGSGVPIAEVLLAAGFRVFGVDASPTLVAAFRRRFPAAEAACEAAQDSVFFGRRFDAAVAIGLIFLLRPEAQRAVIARTARALAPGGHFLFTAPRQACGWTDTLTNRPSHSLGLDAYRELLDQSGLRLVATYADEGDNHYLHATRAPG
ncbi:class I SAM-dependent methyltransferase [Myxococcus sp. Y35]|uniref:class I SAM-dependent methyltransferase n=1 Tax=Pseudomyxococcus flavus TaxID=3115648 RepID=UPI003CEF12FA